MTLGQAEARHPATTLLRFLLIAIALQWPRITDARFHGSHGSHGASELTLESRGHGDREDRSPAASSAARQVRMHRARSRQALRHTITSPLQVEVQEAAGPVSFLQVHDDSVADTEVAASQPTEVRDAAQVHDTRSEMAAVSLAEEESISGGASKLRSNSLEFDRLAPVPPAPSPPSFLSDDSLASVSASASASGSGSGSDTVDPAADSGAVARVFLVPEPSFDGSEAHDVVVERLEGPFQPQKPLPNVVFIVAGAALCGMLLFGRSLAVVLLDRWKAPQAVHSPTWDLVEALPKTGLADLERILPEELQYDCPVVKAVRSNMVVRLEARILPPANPSDVLIAPLSNKECLLYSATVVKQVADTSQNLPLAFAMATLDFRVALLDAPEVEIQVHGADVSLLAMVDGCYLQRRRADRISEHFHDFMTAHRTFPHPSFNVRSGHTLLEFKELSLAVGATVTLVGELHRDPLGQLSLRPQSAVERPSSGLDDMFGFGRPSISKDVPEPEEQAHHHYQLDRVLLSDHPLLRNGQKVKLGTKRQQSELPLQVPPNSWADEAPPDYPNMSSSCLEKAAAGAAELLSCEEKQPHHFGCNGSGDTGGSGCCSPA